MIYCESIILRVGNTEKNKFFSVRTTSDVCNYRIKVKTLHLLLLCTKNWILWESWMNGNEWERLLPADIIRVEGEKFCCRFQFDCRDFAWFDGHWSNLLTSSQNETLLFLVWDWEKHFPSLRIFSSKPRWQNHKGTGGTKLSSARFFGNSAQAWLVSYWLVR